MARSAMRSRCRPSDLADADAGVESERAIVARARTAGLDELTPGAAITRPASLR